MVTDSSRRLSRRAFCCYASKEENTVQTLDCEAYQVGRFDVYVVHAKDLDLKEREFEVL